MTELRAVVDQASEAVSRSKAGRAARSRRGFDDT